MEKLLKLPLGLTVNGQYVKEVPLARTGGEAEAIYTQKPSASELYTWFGEVVSASIKSIGDEEVLKPFLKSVADGTPTIPAIVKKIPLNDIGTLVLQIQTECWRDVIKEQQIVCKFCADNLTADIDLKNIGIEVNELQYETVRIKLPTTYEINHGDIEVLKAYNGQKYNYAVIRVPVLADAIRHEKVSADMIMFWRNIGFDCLLGLEYQETDDAKAVSVDEGYIARRGKLLFTKDWDTKTLNAMRTGLTDLPSAKFYYESKCPCARKKTIPYFTDMNNFFS